MLCKIKEIFRNTKSNTDLYIKILKTKRIINKSSDEYSGLLYELGNEVYYNHLNNANDNTSVNELIELINEKQTYIKSLKNELNIYNGHIECNHCGKLTSYSFDFCPFCGVKLFKNSMNYSYKSNDNTY